MKRALTSNREWGQGCASVGCGLLLAIIVVAILAFLLVAFYG